MTKEKQVDLGTYTVESLADRPVDELAVFIGGDSDVFQTLVTEINNLNISEEEKNKRLDNVYRAAKESGVDFLALDKAEKIATQLDE